jgi:hypothetical protein
MHSEFKKGMRRGDSGSRERRILLGRVARRFFLVTTDFIYSLLPFVEGWCVWVKASSLYPDQKGRNKLNPVYSIFIQ